MSIANAIGYDGFPVPVGVMLPFAGVIFPKDWLLCDGSAFDPAEYPELFRLRGNVATVPNMDGNLTSTFPNNDSPEITGNVTFDLTPENIPSFSVTYGGSTWTAQLPHDGRHNAVGDRITGGTNVYLQQDSKVYPDSNGITVTDLNLSVDYNGGEAPVITPFNNIVNFQLPAIAIKYIIKAK
jgi:microcystin-dependent protein